MSELAAKRCVPCEGGAFPLTREETAPLLAQVQGWSLSEDAAHVSKTFTSKDFNSAMQFAQKIAAIADEENHHPDLHVSWGKVRVLLTTHAIKGLSENDFILAAKIDLVN